MGSAGLATRQRYADLRQLAPPRAFRVLAGSRVRDGRRVVLVTAGPEADPPAAREALLKLADAHSRIAHPAVPRTSAVDLGPAPSVELDVPAVAGGFEVVALLARAGVKIPYAAGDAFVVGVREALQAAHGTRGGPFCLGRLSIGNVLFDSSGHASVLGFGANVITDDEHGRADPRVRYFEAAERLGQGPPSPMTDYVALLQLARSVLTHVALPGPLARIVEGRPRPTERALLEALRWVEARVIHEAPGMRAALPEALHAAQRIRRFLGVTLDREGFARTVAERLASPDEALDGAVVVVAADGAWIERSGQPRRRVGPAQRRLLCALFDRHALGDATALSTWELLELGWPGEQPTYEVGMNRVHATLSRLRRLGLDDAIERWDDGYRLAPTASVRRARGA